MARITTDQTIVVSINPVTASGAPANIDGDASFSALHGSGGNAGSFEQISPTSARYTPVHPGIIQIGVTLDADLDSDETRTLNGSGLIEVILPEEEATSFAVVFGDPE